MICSFLRSPRNTDVAVMSAQVRLLGLHKADMNIRGSLNQILCASTIDLFFWFLDFESCHIFCTKVVSASFFQAILADGLQHFGEHWREMSGASKSFAPFNGFSMFQPWNSIGNPWYEAETLSVLHHFKAWSGPPCLWSFQKKHQDDCQGWCVICQCWFRKLLKSGESEFEYTIRTYTIYDNMVSFTLDKMGPLDHLSTSFARYLIVCL